MGSDPEITIFCIQTLLDSNGFRPIYVDLTRKDLEIPVVRAIVPDMELWGDVDYL
ncbi:MAG: YcaO-like family protein [Desulfobacterales bacterium]